MHGCKDNPLAGSIFNWDKRSPYKWAPMYHGPHRARSARGNQKTITISEMAVRTLVRRAYQLLIDVKHNFWHLVEWCFFREKNFMSYDIFIGLLMKINLLGS